MKKLALGTIKLYSWLLSPLMGRNCRFYPTCSQYTYQAVEEYGVLKGIWMGVKRIGKCHPLHKGPMHDPLPAKGSIKGPNKASPKAD
ncbi:MAG: membrane protein insertion efficiency factor YidD [Alphaproteobacteria bacterium]|nr:membrane protein insertion efficiency factor YidD [Alphaproteobacteria bacterium]